MFTYTFWQCGTVELTVVLYFIMQSISSCKFYFVFKQPVWLYVASQLLIHHLRMIVSLLEQYIVIVLYCTCMTKTLI